MNRLVVVSNRVALPRASRVASGGMAVGLMAALRETGGMWFGWDGKVLDPLPMDAQILKQDEMTFATVSLSARDYKEFYLGYANRVLWPLFHACLNLVEFRHAYLEAYKRVNAMFFRKLAPLLEPEDIIWVHDYHCIPMATEMRRAGITQPIGFFLHIPFPPYDILRALPDHENILHDLCAYDVVGFQTDLDLDAFLHNLKHSMGASVDQNGVVKLDGLQVRPGVFPIGIDVDEVTTEAARGRNSKPCRRLQESLSGRQLLIGVDRLDYCKGLVERFRAFERLLEIYPDNRGKVVFMQIAQPSRSDVPEYQEIRRALEAVAGEINGRFSEYDWAPLRYLNKSFGRSRILGFLAISRVGLVTPLRDGMNLVAKEFIAAQDPGDPGVLVLSHLTGAARELKDAVLVNPYDIDDVADGIARAITMPLAERRERWESSMNMIRKNDITAWRRGFIESLTERA